LVDVTKGFILRIFGQSEKGGKRAARRISLSMAALQKIGKAQYFLLA